MSTYENYGEASQHYDATREAQALEIILGCLAGSGRPLAGQFLLDAGCGTGNYASALLEHVGRVIAVDLNEGMLAAARGKLGDALAAGRVELHRAPIDALPCADGTLDAVVVNQVLHHLPRPGDGWPTVRAAVAELARVLRPGGSLVVNICSQAQLRHGWWFAGLIPEAVEAMCGRHPSLDVLESIMGGCGLSPAGRYVPLHVAMQGEHYLDGLGPTRASWRRGDSIWTTVGDGRLAEVCARLEALHAAGELDGFVAREDRRRAELGQLTFVHALKPA